MTGSKSSARESAPAHLKWSLKKRRPRAPTQTIAVAIHRSSSLPSSLPSSHPSSTSAFPSWALSPCALRLPRANPVSTNNIRNNSVIHGLLGSEGRKEKKKVSEGGKGRQEERWGEKSGAQAGE